MMRTAPPRLVAQQMSSSFLRLTAILAAHLFIFSTAVLDAQVLYGSLVGNVTDATGAALPGATVIATHSETRRVRETVTDDSGAYRFPTVQTGTYTIAVNLTGFQSFTRADVEVTLNSVTRVDAALRVGQLQETVTVSAESPALQTDRSELRHELRSQELQDLPVAIGRTTRICFARCPASRRPRMRIRSPRTRPARSRSTSTAPAIRGTTRASMA
jgi:hypothetical protein